MKTASKYDLQSGGALGVGEKTRHWERGLAKSQQGHWRIARTRSAMKAWKGRRFRHAKEHPESRDP